MAANVAGVALSVEGGADLADRVDPRLISMRLTEAREGEADELELTLQNHDGLLETPETGRYLILALGWRSGDAVATGMVDKGRFKVDEVSESGPPDVVTIRARSADLTGTYRKRRTEIWQETTLGAILQRIARRNEGTARIEPALAAIAIASIEQEGKSDMAFVRDLGRRYDAVATWKDGILIFLPIGGSATAGGTPLPARTLRKIDGWAWSFTRADREDNDGAEAQWHDKAAGRRRTVKVGGDNRKRLKRVYASEAEARQAADGAMSRARREPYSFDYELAIADPELQLDQTITLEGWNTRIDGRRWIVESIETHYGAGGLIQRIKLESA
ncbi:contractile injection system protein, VgrG/Pvc8 family [Pelagerythrobacter sp.]|uniref:contractile injection system protein, VgrG/Pvc8 family n=1 Tax=Pelagerythrobacter sp. TaxID=2800702 RepID=UPI0035B1D2E3